MARHQPWRLPNGMAATTLKVRHREEGMAGGKAATVAGGWLAQTWLSGSDLAHPSSPSPFHPLPPCLTLSHCLPSPVSLFSPSPIPPPTPAFLCDSITCALYHATASSLSRSELRSPTSFSCLFLSGSPYMCFCLFLFLLFCALYIPVWKRRGMGIFEADI